MSYFAQFPTLQYANSQVRDISRRVVVPKSVLRQPMAFSPYTVEEGQSQALVSYMYYNQDDDDWMISLANQIVDPYYGWYMNLDEFNKFIIQKYGSVEEAMGRVVQWVCNWAEDTTQLRPDYYDTNLTENLKKYWIPNFGAGTKILSYKRRQEDWSVSTNMIQKTSCTLPVAQKPGELITIYNAGNKIGSGEVVSVTGANVVAKHIQGTWNNGFTLSTKSGNTVISAVHTPSVFIPNDETVYFSPIYAYDLEYDKNEQNKEVLLIQDTYRGMMYTELLRDLKK